jgi:hypothetical protein
MLSARGSPVGGTKLRQAGHDPLLKPTTPVKNPPTQTLPAVIHHCDPSDLKGQKTFDASMAMVIDLGGTSVAPKPTIFCIQKTQSCEGLSTSFYSLLCGKGSYSHTIFLISVLFLPLCLFKH